MDSKKTNNKFYMGNNCGGNVCGKNMDMLAILGNTFNSNIVYAANSKYK